MAAAEDITAALRLVRDDVWCPGSGFSGFFKKDCTHLARLVSLLVHLLEEMRESEEVRVNCEPSPSSSLSGSCFAGLAQALQAAKRLVLSANDFDGSKSGSDGSMKKIIFQFQCVTWKLEKALASLPYNDFNVSEEVQEQVDLVRAQLRRATERYGGPLDSTLLQRALSQPLDRDIDPIQPRSTFIGNLYEENILNIDDEVNVKLDGLDEVCSDANLVNSSTSSEVCVPKDSESMVINSSEENKKPDISVIPDDFLCPISLELMRDPVVAATGQTYERSFIQRWIDCGNTTCPKTQQKLDHLTLTPNYALRSLISQYCLKHNIQQHPASLRLRKTDGPIEILIRKLTSRSIEDRRSALSEIRSLSKQSTDNRILLAQSGAIPILVDLLTSDDAKTQDNAVTCVLNLSIYEDNKGPIMFANAVPSIVQVLRSGSMEAKENAAAALFSLSIANENKIIIGASGAITALVDLLENGSKRGKKDAATALFNLCIYPGNKGRAVRAGIVDGLSKMLTGSGGCCMVDEALTVLSVLACHGEARTAIVKANMIPVLVDNLRQGSIRGKENAAAILLCLGKMDGVGLVSLCGLAGMMALTELAESGTERAKRKAKALLELIRKPQQV